MNYFLGIDGGGTRTTACLGDEAGNVVVRLEGGPSNPLKVGFRAAERELLRLARAALRQARIAGTAPHRSHVTALEAVCAGIAGIDRPVVHDPLLAWMQRHIPARHHLLTSDAALALAAAVGDSPGIIVIAGTGSIAFARDDRGRLLRAGGWGIPFDDIGSGYDLGRQAVAAALQAFDGRGPETCLPRQISRALKLPNITAIVPRHLEQQQIAALFPVVSRAAERGDLVARHLCSQAARDLAQLASALLQRAGWLRRSVPVILTGGVFQASPLIRRGFERRLRRIAPLARVELMDQPPVAGALWLARSHATTARWRATPLGKARTE